MSPPKCIFPKDVAFRLNLITVPSCDKHNSQKSKNDELFRHIITTAPKNNELAQEILSKSVIPSLERRPHIIETFLPHPTPLMTPDGPTASYRVDRQRFDQSIRSIVRGLYFHEHAKKLNKKLTVIWGAFYTRDHSATPHYKFTMEVQKSLPPLYRGENPRVFRYSFDTLKKASLCRLQFYEGIPIFITWKTDL